MIRVKKKPLVLLGIGIVLLLGSSVGATRAANVYRSEAKNVDFSTSELSVDLIESADGVNGKSVAASKTLELGGISDEVKIGKKYEEHLEVVNTSEKYSEYVRVKVRKYWLKKDGSSLKKDTSLDPALIKLDIDEGVWFKNPNEHTYEEDVYYLTAPLSKETGISFVEGVTIDDTVTTEVVTSGITGTITNTYVYDSADFTVEVEVDAIQTHNAAEAIYGAWGVRVECDAVDDGNITVIEGNPTDKPKVIG